MKATFRVTIISVFIFINLFLSSVVWAAESGVVVPPEPVLPVPSAEQLAWQRMEFTMFLHFGVNTFTNQEWGDGSEDPEIFQPRELDCRQWVKSAKAAGFKLMILTAKHHDGFCLWPSKFTDHSVKSSSWRDGKGDVARDFVEACKAEGMKVGFYLSPWDRHDKRYGTEDYNVYFKNQLRELLTLYGRVDEVWFDGARKGEGTPYDWQGFYGVVRKHAPQAVIAIVGPDIRWVGNESGVARVGESSVQKGRQEMHGHTGPIWYPAECDVSIRPGWFWHPEQDSQVKSVEHLMDIYFKSVGRNSVLLMNVPPNNKGLFSAEDVVRLREFKMAVDAVLQSDLALGKPVRAENVRGGSEVFGAAKAVDGDPDTFWATDDSFRSCYLEVDLQREVVFNVVNVQEAIALGERVQKYHVEIRDGQSQWQTIARGSVIGHRNLLRVATCRASKVRLVIDEAKGAPAISSFGVFMTRWPGEELEREPLTASKPARASNVHPGGTAFGADKAVDNDENTRWATADEVRQSWLEVDLTKTETIGRMSIKELQPRIEKFQLEYKMAPDDPWKVAMSGTKAGLDYQSKFPTVKARLVRLHILEATSAPTIWEFKVFGPGD